MSNVEVKQAVSVDLGGAMAFITGGSEARTSSLQVAEVFSKEHKHVLRDIAGLEERGLSKEFTESNFGLTSYIDESGKVNKSYTMTKNGFIMIAMGYSGARAMAFKEAYIAEFDRLAKAARGLELLGLKIQAEHGYYTAHPELVEFDDG